MSSLALQCAIIVCLLILLITFTVPQAVSQITFLDVGQGDAILLQTGTAQVLIDGGQGAAVIQRLGEEMPWFDRSIEVVVATHPDRDHLEGLLRVLEKYDVGLVLLPKKSHTSQLQAAWLDMLQETLARQQVAYRFAWRGQQLTVSPDLSLRLLGPWQDAEGIYDPSGKTNNAAVLTRADFCPHQKTPQRSWSIWHQYSIESKCLSFLLTSDAESPVEKRLVREDQGELDVDVLKAGHHGSKTSTTAELLSAASPQSIVISVGADNQFGHPHPNVLARLQPYQLWRTDQRGSIRWQYVGNQWLLQMTR